MFEVSRKLPSGKVVTFTPINSRVVVLTGNPAFYAEETNEQTKEINTIIYENSLRISIGDTLNLSVKQDDKSKREPFKVKYITKGKDGGYLLFASKRTDSSIFLTPLLGNNYKWFKWDTHFINTYPKVDKKFHKQVNEDKLYFIYLLYRFSSDDEFLEFESKIRAHKNFVRTIEPDSNHTMFVMKVPEDKEEDYNIILQGKYSKISDETKRQIIVFHEVDAEHTISQILIKGQKRRKDLIEQLGRDIKNDLDELYKKIDIGKETYNGT